MTRKTSEVQWLVADPELRRQATSAMVVALAPIPNSIYIIRYIAADILLEFMLSISPEMTPPSKRSHGSQGWCADSGVRADINAIW